MKLEELRKKLAILSLITSLLLTSGCSNTSNVSITSTTTEINTTETQEEISTELSKEDLRAIELEEYKEFFNNFPVDYKIEDYLITDEEINQIISNANTKKECDFEFDGDYDNIRNLIINNSREYVQNHPEFQGYFTEYGNAETRCSCNFELIHAIESLKDSTNDVNEDICHMQTLKIVVGNIGNNFGYYNDEENLIVISIDYIKLYAEEKGLDWEEELRITLMHEINHMREFTCDCRLEKGDQTLSIDYQSAVSLLDEAPAESEIYNLERIYYDNYDTSNYTNVLEREGEGFLLLPILMENKNIDDYYNAIFDSDINNFCNFFNAQNPDEIKDLYRIIYSLDSTLNRSEFPNRYFGENISDGYTRGDLLDAVGYDYKKQTFKIALQNLINYTENNEDFSLKDNLILLYIIRDEIVTGTYDMEAIEDDNGEVESYIYKIDKNFINDITSLNNKYIEYLCFKYNVTMEDIDNLSLEISLTIHDIEYYSNGEYSKCFKYTYAYDFCKKFPLIEPFMRSKDNMYCNRYNNLLEGNVEYYDESNINLTYNMNQ